MALRACMIVFAVVMLGVLADASERSDTIVIHARPLSEPAVRHRPAPPPPAYYYYPDGPYYPAPRIVPPPVFVPTLRARPVAPPPMILRQTPDGIILEPDTRIYRFIPRGYPDFLTTGTVTYNLRYGHPYPYYPPYW